MRSVLVSLFFSLQFLASGQIALDGWFIPERWMLNASASLLSYEGVDSPLLKNSEDIRTYALDEPYYWVDRIYLRIYPNENPTLVESSAHDSLLSLFEVINLGIDSNEVDVFTDLEYTGPADRYDRKQVLASPFVLKVDMEYDTLTEEMIPHFIGMSLEQPDGRMVHLYYPQLRYVLKRYKVRASIGLIPYDEFFEGWLFNAHRISRGEIKVQTDCTRCLPPMDQQAEFDALTDLFLIDRAIAKSAIVRSGTKSISISSFGAVPVQAQLEFDGTGEIKRATILNGKELLLSIAYDSGRPNGKFRSFYPGGGPKEEGTYSHGSREGPWVAWYPDGQMRSDRNYAGGRLDGMQHVYHPNGLKYLEYGMARGEYQGVHQTFYDDGSVKSSGSMDRGFVTGEWIYAIRINDTLKAYLDTNASFLNMPSSVWQDNLITYRVTYTDNGLPGPMNSCLLNRCIQWTYSDIE